MPLLRLVWLSASLAINGVKLAAQTLCTTLAG